MDWLGFLLTAVGLFLLAHKRIICWPILLISNAAWISYWIPRGELAALGMTGMYVVLNLYAYWQWRRDGKPKIPKSPGRAGKRRHDRNAGLRQLDDSHYQVGRLPDVRGDKRLSDRARRVLQGARSLH
jgi:hypothetical protein